MITKERDFKKKNPPYSSFSHLYLCSPVYHLGNEISLLLFYRGWADLNWIILFIPSPPLPLFHVFFWNSLLVKHDSFFRPLFFNETLFSFLLFLLLANMHQAFTVSDIALGTLRILIHRTLKTIHWLIKPSKPPSEVGLLLLLLQMRNWETK